MRNSYRKYTEMKCSDCGGLMKIRNDYLSKHSGTCMSCQKIGNTNARKHGKYNTRLYRIWTGLKFRRYKYKPVVCKEWEEYETFKEWANSSGYSKELTIDRIDNKGGYSPDNCQWITLKENSAKDKIIFTDKEKIEIYEVRKILGVTQVEMARLLDVSRNTIQRAETFAKEQTK